MPILTDIKKMITPEHNPMPEDDFRIIDSWVINGEGGLKSRELEYICYEFETIDPETGTKTHLYKAIRFAKVERLPKSAKQSTSLMDMQASVLSAAHEQGYNLVTMIANIINPVPIGLLYLYGVQGVADNIEEAKRRANLDYKGFIGSMMGTFRVLHLRTVTAEEGAWLQEKMRGMKFMTSVRGIPKASKTGEDIGNKGMGGSNLNPDSEGTLEEIITALADYEYVIEILSTPVKIRTLEAWQNQTQKQMTEWYGQLQGSKSLSFNLSIPMTYMTSTGSSQGWNKGYSESHTMNFSQGESYNTGYSENVGESISHSLGESFGHSTGTSETDSTGTSHSVSQGITQGQTIGHTIGNTHGVSHGTSNGTSMNYSNGLSNGSSNSHSSGVSNSLSKSFGTSQSAGTSDSSSFGTSHSQGTSHSEGQSEGQTQGYSHSTNKGLSSSINHSLGISQSDSYGSGTSNSQSTGKSGSTSHSDSHSDSSSHGGSNGWSKNHSDGGSTNDSTSISNSKNNNNTVGLSAFGGSYNHGGGTSDGLTTTSGTGTSYSDTKGHSGSKSYSYGTSDGYSDSTSNGWSTGQSTGTSTNESHGTGSSESYSVGSGTSYSEGYGTSFGTSNSTSISNGTSLSDGTSQSHSMGTSTSNGQSTSMGQSNGNSMSDSYGTTLGQSMSKSAGLSQGTSSSTSDSVSNSDSYSNSYSQSNSVSDGTSSSHSVGKSNSESYTQSVSNGTGQSWGSSNSVSNGTSKSTSEGDSSGVTYGSSGTYTTGTSGSMGIGPSIGYNKSYQWLDQQVKDIIELLEYQNERLKKALRSNGAFYTYVYIACPDMDSLSVAQAAAKSTWQNTLALTQPIQVLDLTEEEQAHLLYHFTAFSADVTRQNIAGVSDYKYCTVLLPEEYIAYTHLPRISEGGIDTIVDDVPKFRVPGRMTGQIYMGTQLNSERYTFKHGYRTQFDYRINIDELMHGIFTGASRSGKTVAAMRFVRELARARRTATGKRLRIVIMDPKQDWRGMARFVEPERFRFFSLGNTHFRPIDLNPCKIPYGVEPQHWVDGFINIYCRAYGLLERGKQMISDIFYDLYNEAGVFGHEDEEEMPETWEGGKVEEGWDWKAELSYRSSKVTFHKAYMTMNARNLEFTSGKKKTGNDTLDAYSRLMERLSCFNRPFSIEYRLFSSEGVLKTEGNRKTIIKDKNAFYETDREKIANIVGTGVGIDELIGADDVTVFESFGLESTFANFIFGIITSGFYKIAKGFERGFLNPSQYETVLIIEEANKVLVGNDTASSAGSGGGASLSGQSEFEEILDQAAGYGLFIIAITQTVSQMPTSIIANCGLLFIGKISKIEDVDLAVRMIGREGRIEDRDVVKWFPKSPTGWFICRSNRGFDFRDAEPVLVQIEPLNAATISNAELDEILYQRDMQSLVA